jgi:hypothetical protein
VAGSSSGIANELKELEKTRARLEAALSTDENWRTLKQSRAEAASPAEERAHRRLRDARLELSLLSNPLYRAWKHVDDAIEVLRKNQEAQGNTGALDSVHLLVSGNAAKEVASLASLSHGIARLMQRRMSETDEEPALTRLESLAAPAPPAPVISEPATVFEDPSAAAEEEGIVHMARSAQEREAAAGEDGSRSAESASAPPRPQRRATRPRTLDLDEPPFDPRFDPKEASVTFVTREPASPRRGGTERKPASPERGVESPAAVDAPNASFSAGLDIEEAEVTILTPEQRQQSEETAQRDGNRRRFRKALLGD